MNINDSQTTGPLLELILRRKISSMDTSTVLHILLAMGLLLVYTFFLYSIVTSSRGLALATDGLL